jgi:Tfp pilus assembly protein PilZ
MTQKSFIEKMMDKWFGSEPQGDYPQLDSDERRRVKREQMTIPVTIGLPDGETRDALARNLSPIGLFIETSLELNQGDQLRLTFSSSDASTDTIELVANVIWSTPVAPPGFGLQLDQAKTSNEAIKTYRSMVFHYIRHPPEENG